MILLKIEEIGGPGIVLKKLNVLKKRTFFVMGVFWHRDLRPKHFTKAGAREYKYKPRKGDPGNIGRFGFERSYQGRKLDTKKHTKPLVYSGDSEALSRVRDVRSTSKGNKIVMRTNRLNLKNPHSEIDMRPEMEIISERETPSIIAEGERELDKEINAFEGRVVSKQFGQPLFFTQDFS